MSKITRIVKVLADWQYGSYRWRCSGSCALPLRISMASLSSYGSGGDNVLEVNRDDIPCIVECPDCHQEYRVEWCEKAEFVPQEPRSYVGRWKVTSGKSKKRQFPPKVRHRQSVY